MAPADTSSASLSVVVALRNDDHGGYQLEKLELFGDCLATLSRRFSVPTELIIVEWNPLPWAKPLADVVEPAEGIDTRIITVPPDLHRSLANSDVIEFFQMIAKNVGIRRARYGWVLSTNPDQILNEECVRVIPTLDPGLRAVYRAPRCDLDIAFPEAADYDAILQECAEHVVVRHDGLWGRGQFQLHTDACGDFTLMRQEHWWEVEGYPELALWSIHIDSLGLVSFVGNGLGEAMIVGAESYHFKHTSSWVSAPDLAKKLPSVQLAWVDAALMLVCAPHTRVRWNGRDWGFADHDLEEVTL